MTDPSESLPTSVDVLKELLAEHAKEFIPSFEKKVEDAIASLVTRLESTLHERTQGILAGVESRIGNMLHGHESAVGAALVAGVEAVASRVLSAVDERMIGRALQETSSSSSSSSSSPSSSSNEQPKTFTTVISREAEQEALDNAAGFPTLDQFVAMGFYADTYEHQRAAWELKNATPTPETTEENGSSVPATGASSEIR